MAQPTRPLCGALPLQLCVMPGRIMIAGCGGGGRPSCCPPSSSHQFCLPVFGSNFGMGCPVLESNRGPVGLPDIVPAGSAGVVFTRPLKASLRSLVVAPYR